MKINNTFVGRWMVGFMFLFGPWLGVASASENEHEAEHPRHALAVFTGATEVEEKFEATLGLEYTFHINHRWSAWGLWERSDREEDTTVMLAGVGLHPYKDLV